MFLLDIKIMQQFLRAVIFRAYNVHKEICQLARIFVLFSQWFTNLFYSRIVMYKYLPMENISIPFSLTFMMISSSL